MINIINKTLRFYRREPKIIIKLFIFVAFIVVFFLELIVLRYQTTQLAKIQSEKELVLRIPEMEEKLSPGEVIVFPDSNTVKVVSENEKSASVRGLVQQNGSKSILINNYFFKEGDYFEGYRIMKIYKDSVYLQNEDTFARKYIYFDK